MGKQKLVSIGNTSAPAFFAKYSVSRFGLSWDGIFCAIFIATFLSRPASINASKTSSPWSKEEINKIKTSH